MTWPFESVRLTPQTSLSAKDEYLAAEDQVVDYAGTFRKASED
jgi:hypothetical protein